MKYMIRHKDGRYDSIVRTEETRLATKFETRGQAVVRLGILNEDWRENARIVRLRPKAKPATIPVPVIEASNGYLMVNRNTVFYMPPSVLNVDAVAKNLRRALGLPEQP